MQARGVRVLAGHSRRSSARRCSARAGDELEPMTQLQRLMKMELYRRRLIPHARPPAKFSGARSRGTKQDRAFNQQRSNQLETTARSSQPSKIGAAVAAACSWARGRATGHPPDCWELEFVAAKNLRGCPVLEIEPPRPHQIHGGFGPRPARSRQLFCRSKLRPRPPAT